MKAADLVESIQKLNINNGDIVVVTAKLPGRFTYEIAKFLATEINKLIPEDINAKILICDNSEVLLKIDVLKENEIFATAKEEKS